MNKRLNLKCTQVTNGSESQATLPRMGNRAIPAKPSMKTVTLVFSRFKNLNCQLKTTRNLVNFRHTPETQTLSKTGGVGHIVRFDGEYRILQNELLSDYLRRSVAYEQN